MTTTLLLVMLVAFTYSIPLPPPTTPVMAQSERSVEEAHEISHEALAPMATSGDNVYVAWWSNKTGNNEILFRASTDGGKTFSDKIKLSNSSQESVSAEIAASGHNVYVSWWEEVRNATKEIREPVLTVSTDNGATFGPVLHLAANGTIGGSK